jgi:hypothetical protein
MMADLDSAEPEQAKARLQVNQHQVNQHQMNQ